MKVILSVIFFCFLFLQAGAQVEPIEADRPDQTETPAIVPRKHFQFETGIIVEEDKENNIQQKTFTYPTILAKYGVNSRFELRLIIENSRIEKTETGMKSSVNGISPVKIGFKTRLFEEKGIIPVTSFIFHLGIPKLAGKDQQTDHLSTEFRFAMQHGISKKVSIGYNLGAEWDGISAEATGTYTITTGFKFTEKLGAYVELFGFVPEKANTSHSFDCGISFLPHPDIMMDISGGVGINKYAPDYFIGLGFSARIPK